MKTIYLFLGLLVGVLFSLTAHSQTTYQFSYDARGNRVMRAATVIELRSAVIRQDSLQFNKPVVDQIGLQKTIIYPNPTKGLLRIELPSLNDAQAIMRLHDSSGRLIIQKTAVETNNEIDLSAHPTGIYILKISVGNTDQKEWKIIKE